MNHIHRPQRPAVIAYLAAISLVAGCGDDWKAATVPATGRVSINGKSPKGLLVQLVPTGTPVDVRNSRPWAKVQDDGTFTLSAYEDREGIPPGEYAVTLVWPADASIPGSPDRLGHRYDKFQQSKWKVVVKPGIENVLPPIELTDVAVKDNPRASAAEKAIMAP